MTKHFNINPRTLFLGSYAASLPFSSVQVFPGWSLPFLFALAFFAYKAYDMLANRYFLRLSLGGLLIGVLYCYLITAELYIHDATVVNTYFISLGLNCVMLLLVADDFHRAPATRDHVMCSYVTVSVLVSFFVTLGVLTTVPATGRVTFLGLNQNELAGVLLISYCWLSIHHFRTNNFQLAKQLLFLASSILVLNAMLSTGTRFTLVGVIFILLFLSFSTISYNRKNKAMLIYIPINVLFIFIKVVDFSPMYERLLPNNTGNNLADLGGRLLLWRDAFDSFKESPLIGLGYNGYKEFVLGRERFFELPHSLPFEMSAIAGTIGITLLVILGISLCWRVFTSNDIFGRFEALIWSIPLLILISMVNISHTKIVWFLLAYFMTLSFSRNDEVAKDCRNRVIT